MFNGLGEVMLVPCSTHKAHLLWARQVGTKHVHSLSSTQTCRNKKVVQHLIFIIKHYQWLHISFTIMISLFV